MTTTNESSKHIDPAVDAVTTLRAIAEFPVADQFNQDAINMKLTAQNFFHREVARKNLGEIPEGLSKPADGGPAFPRAAGDYNGSRNGNCSQTGMSVRAYAAIALRVPNSGIDWLDDMIRASKRDAFDVAIDALRSYRQNWDHGLPAEYAQGERIAMECAVEAAIEALEEARG
ncbi:hypothetical protein [Burkholderia glumae]|uniref:hypothetical protein n=1 Tax=Burkholderia glumae TaxID=337 RepID=UPI0002D2BB29|nr:hypothetical protein [Burkholderia glumae]